MTAMPVATDRLAEAGLVERRQGVDRRSLALQPTADGVASRNAMLAQRQAALDRLLEPLDDQERAPLARLLAKMLERLPQSALHGLSICRLCDDAHCADCPIDAGIARVVGAA